MIRKLFGHFHPRWMLQRFGKRLQLIWTDGCTVIPYPRSSRRVLVSPNGKDTLRLHFWTKFLLPIRRSRTKPQQRTRSLDTMPANDDRELVSYVTQDIGFL